MNPTRSRLLDILILLGVGISVTQLEEQHNELRGTVKVEGRGLGTVTIAGGDTAALIDEIPVLAAIAPYTAGGMEIRDARELRVKESDRIAAIAPVAGTLAIEKCAPQRPVSVLHFHGTADMLVP